MQIAVNTRFLIKNRLEGLGVYTKEVSQRLVNLLPEHEWHFLYDRAVDDEFKIEGVHHHTIYPSARHPFLWYWWFEHSIPSKLKNLGVDVFFSPDGYCSLSSNVKQILTVHDIAFEHYPEGIPTLVNRYYRHFVPKFCQKADRIVAISSRTAKDIVKKYEVDESKITVISNGYSEDFKPIDFHEQTLIRQQVSGGAPYYIYIGAIHPRKNVLNILKAFEQMLEAHPDLPHQLVLIGRDAWGNQDLTHFLENMRFKNRVIWKTHQSRYDVARWVAASEALIYPSFYEGFGLPVLEAMACGIPSITSKESPMEDFAKDSCLAINPFDIQELSDAMYYLIQQPPAKEEMGKKALSLSRNYTWDKCAERIGEIIEGVRI